MNRKFTDEFKKDAVIPACNQKHRISLHFFHHTAPAHTCVSLDTRRISPVLSDEKITALIQRFWLQVGIRLANEIGSQAAADKPDVKIKNIYTWHKAERVASGQATLKGLLPGETAEQGFKRLEKEANELRQANEVLRKALGFIAAR